MRKSTVIALLALTLTATSAFATVTTTWNFDSGLQGWTVQRAAGHLAPTNGGLATWAFTDTSDGLYAAGNYSSQAVYLPDQHYAFTAIPQTNSFTFTALMGYNFNTSTSRMQSAGLGYHDTAAGGYIQDVSAWMEGKSATSSELNFQDSMAVGSANQGQTGILKNAAGSTPANQAIWLTIDYNNLIPGKIVLQARGENYHTNLPGDPAQWTYTKPIGIDPNTNQLYTVDALRLGGAYSWAQVYADNASLTDYTRTVPEPGSLMVLGTGLVGLAGFLRRRK